MATKTIEEQIEAQKAKLEALEKKKKEVELQNQIKLLERLRKDEPRIVEKYEQIMAKEAEVRKQKRRETMAKNRQAINKK